MSEVPATFKDALAAIAVLDTCPKSPCTTVGPETVVAVADSTPYRPAVPIVSGDAGVRGVAVGAVLGAVVVLVGGVLGELVAMVGEMVGESVVLVGDALVGVGDAVGAGVTGGWLVLTDCGSVSTHLV